MSAPDPAKKLNALLRTLRAAHPDAAHADADPAHRPPECCPLTSQLVFSMLVWESSVPRAGTAFRRLFDSFADLNDLRAALPAETAAALGESYPLARERAERLRAALMDIYKREHEMSLHRLLVMPKRDARAYVASLDGVPPFAADRVALLALGAHCMPVDERLRAVLVGAGALDPALPLPDASAWLERHVRAADALAVYHALEARASSLQSRPARRPAPPRRRPPRKAGTPGEKGG